MTDAERMRAARLANPERARELARLSNDRKRAQRQAMQPQLGQFDTTALQSVMTNWGKNDNRDA